MLEKGGREVGVGREAAAKPSPKTKRLSRRMACVIVSENNVMHGAFNSTPFCSLRLYFAAVVEGNRCILPSVFEDWYLTTTTTATMEAVRMSMVKATVDGEAIATTTSTGHG